MKTDHPLYKWNYEDMFIPACIDTCKRLSIFEVTALLCWSWDDYIEERNPGCKAPWEMSPSQQQKALAEILEDRAETKAYWTGLEVEERMVFGDHEEDSENSEDDEDEE
jgi:hypothetical protein